MEYALASPSTNFLDPQLAYRLSETPLPSFFRRHGPCNGTALVDGNPDVESHKKVTSCGFLPLPSIIASPVCTPTSSLSPQPHAPEKKNLSKSLYVIGPTSSSPPTWISTPPTPPPRMVRRSITCFTRPSSQFPPSASFPTSGAPPETSFFVKRCASVPSLSRRPRALDTLVISTNSPRATSNTDFMKRPRPIFHIPRDMSTDTEDTTPLSTASLDLMIEEASTKTNLSDNDYDNAHQSERGKDDIRKYHALRELLATEVGYLLDLRALVTVYLRILPTLACRPSLSFARPSSSFTSTPWINPYSHIHAASVSSSTSFPEPSVSPPITVKDPTRSVLHYLFTDQEIGVLTRSADEILQLHEHFVRELQIEMAPLGFHMEAKLAERSRQHALQNIDAAIRTVSTKFATEASRFASYETFCPGHPEALDLVRRAQSQHPLEWDAFEQHCSSLILELELTHHGDLDTPEPVSSEEFDVAVVTAAPTKNRTRATSLSSIDGAVRTLRSRMSNMSLRDSITFPTDTARKEKGARLAFDDYLIKPVQRICKYPLLLDQLKTGKPLHTVSRTHLPSDIDVNVEGAAQAMRHVARAVDEARHRQDVAVRSSLIASRISVVHSATSQISPLYPTTQALTPSFLYSLGTCLVAGSLDVIHYHTPKPSSSNIHAKYLGAFLYPGGYLILVKVMKGKVYEPKHWFPLADFDICDLEECDAMLPCSIRLSSKEHRFELAAACQREKDSWLSAIRESRKLRPSWINEPTSSLRLDGKGELIASTLADGPFELVNALPTIQSIPELLNNLDSQSTLPLFNAFGQEMKQKKSPKQEWRPDPDPPSRRSSTASVKAIFSPTPSDSETIVIRRSSASARSRIDQGLQDVISQSCLTARSFASIRDEELFQAPKSTRTGFVRSQSGLSMAGMAKTRLIRHESVRVTRRKSFVDGFDYLSNKKSPSTTQSLTSRRQSKKLTITPLSEGEARKLSSSPHHPTSPSPYFTTSGTLSISLKSHTHSPAAPLGTPTHSLGTRPPLKPSRSLVGNVKGLFSSRSSSTSSLSHYNEASDTEPLLVKMRPPTPGALRWGGRGSLHRRSRSVLDDPEESFTLPNKLPVLDFGTPISTSDMDSESRVLPCLPSDKPSQHKQHFFSAMRTSVEMEPNHGTLKHLSFLQHLKA